MKDHSFQIIIPKMILREWETKRFTFMNTLSPVKNFCKLSNVHYCLNDVYFD